MSRIISIISLRDDMLPEFQSKLEQSGLEVDGNTSQLKMEINRSIADNIISTRVYIDTIGNIELEPGYEDDILIYRALLNSSKAILYGYGVAFSDLSFAKEILKIIADNDDVIVDSDTDIILPGKEMVKKIDLLEY